MKNEDELFTAGHNFILEKQKVTIIISGNFILKMIVNTAGNKETTIGIDTHTHTLKFYVRHKFHNILITLKSSNLTPTNSIRMKN